MRTHLLAVPSLQRTYASIAPEGLVVSVGRVTAVRGTTTKKSLASRTLRDTTNANRIKQKCQSAPPDLFALPASDLYAFYTMRIVACLCSCILTHSVHLLTICRPIYYHKQNKTRQKVRTSRSPPTASIRPVCTLSNSPLHHAKCGTLL